MKKTRCPYCNKLKMVEDDITDLNVTCLECGKEFTAEIIETPEDKYNKAVTNLLIAVGLSIVNLVLILAGSSRSFAFSLWGSELLCEFGGVGVTFAVLLLIVYGVLAFLSKSNKATFIAAFALVCLDTLIGGLICILALLGDDGADMVVSVIIGFIFHGWLLWEMVKGLAAYKVTSK